MNDSDFAEAIARALDSRRGRESERPSEDSLDPRVQDALNVFDLIVLSQQPPPPLAEDPTAIMLGLVADPRDALDGNAAQAARKHAKLSVSELATRLNARGWDATAASVFSWEAGRAATVVPALITAIAEELDVPRDRLSRNVEEDPVRAQLDRMFRSAAFEALVSRWATLKGVTADLAAQALTSRALAAAHRGGAPEAEGVLSSLTELVVALEGEAAKRKP